MKKTIFNGLTAALLSISFLLAGCGQSENKSDLTVFSGAGLIKPVGELITAFEKKNNVKIQAHYGGSGEIFGMLSTGQYCDVLIPGAEKYTEDAVKNGWVREDTIKKVVLHEAIIAVPKGNPAKINSLQDLAKPGVRVALGDPKGPAIGRISKKILMKNKLWEKVLKNVTVKGPTVNQLIIYPALGQVDAAIVWKDVTAWAEKKDKISTIAIPKKENLIKSIPTAVTTGSTNQKLAVKFNSFISSTEGLKVWKKWGFDPCTK